jgi:hypothetical protein
VGADLSSISEMMGLPLGGFNVDWIPHIRTKYYMDCSGCCIKYEDISGLDINTVLFDFQYDEIVADDVLHYYGVHDVKNLVINHRTGIARKKRNLISYLSEPISKNKILIPLFYNGIRTYLSCQQKKDENDRSYYKACNLGRP